MTRDGYTPGWGDDALKMMRSRAASTRAGFVLPLLRNGMRVLDVGCGPGTITRGLAEAVAPNGLAVGVDLRRDGADVLGSVYALPVRSGSVAVAFAHGLAEHLGDLPLALSELHRVLRLGGLLAIASSDWSGAVLDPRTPDVESALQGHYLRRYDAGGDPFAGGRLPAAVREVGFTEVRARDTDWPDMTYRELASYIATRLDSLPDAQAAALRWAQGDGTFSQRWVQVTARR
jgi:ubiquinone/menaquinone biosynthesis C-methylase UbiE